MECRNEAEEEGHGQGGSEGNADHGRVHVHPLGEGRRKADAHPGQQGVQGEVGEKDPQQGPGGSEDQHLGEELSDELGPAGSDSHTDGELLPPLLGSSHEEAGHVCARHEEHQRYASHEEGEGLSDVAHVPLSHGEHRRLRDVASQTGAKLPGDPREVGVGLLQRHVRAHLRYDPSPERSAPVLPRRVTGAEAQGKVERHLPVQGEFRRQDRYDLMSPLPDPERLSHDVGTSAEAGPPEPVGEDHEGLGAGAQLVGAGKGAQDRLHPQEVEEVAHDHAALQDLGALVPPDPEGLGLLHGKAFEDGAPVSPVPVVGDGDGRPEAGGLELVRHDETLGVFVGQRFEEHAVHHREDPGVGADSQSERPHHDRAEDGAPQRTPRRDLDVTQPGLHRSRHDSSPGRRVRLRSRFHAPNSGRHEGVASARGDRFHPVASARSELPRPQLPVEALLHVAQNERAPLPTRRPARASSSSRTSTPYARFPRRSTAARIICSSSPG